jgi:HlyD family secretion protein
MEKRRKIITVIIILVLVLVGFYFIFFRKEKVNYSVEKTVQGTIVQEVSETGTIRMGEEINLGFKNAGKIDKVYVNVGDTVTAGQNLVKLDTSQLAIQLNQAKASLKVAQAQEADANISLDTAENNLANVKQKADDSLNNAYEDSLTVLDDAYLKIYNAFNVAYNIQQTYFTTPNEYGLKVGDEKNRIEVALKTVESLKNSAKNDPSHENIDSILPQAKDMLEKAGNAVEGIRDITDNGVYRDLVLSTDKTSLDTQKLNINTVLANLISAQQTISTTKITNETNMNNAKSQVETLKSQLQTGEGAGLYQAQIDQAEAQVELLEKQIKDATIQSPTDGKIATVNKREGETAQITESVISLLPSAPFQIDVDIYEEDIVKVQLGNPVDIEIAAFPGEVFNGKVILIDPAEKLISDVVYYEVKIDFENPPQGIKSGMTADITIKTERKDNVLIIPDAAVTRKNGKETVEVLKGKKSEVTEVKTGLKGSDSMVEVISGLKEGEQVIIR